MGGSLTAESVVGEGTTFTIELDEVAEAAEPHDDGPARPPEPADDPGEHHTVLYVEDNPSNLRLVERVLAERGGVRLLTTDRGEEVHGLVRQHRPELVLLDLHLSDLDGEEVLRRLLADPRTAQVPVVVVSEDVSPGHIERVLAAGAREYLTKPLDVARFRAVVTGCWPAWPAGPDRLRRRGRAPGPRRGRTGRTPAGTAAPGPVRPARPGGRRGRPGSGSGGPGGPPGPRPTRPGRPGG
jgi:CheY-like chemotaxis protein